VFYLQLKLVKLDLAFSKRKSNPKIVLKTELKMQKIRMLYLIERSVSVDCGALWLRYYFRNLTCWSKTKNRFKISDTIINKKTDRNVLLTSLRYRFPTSHTMLTRIIKHKKALILNAALHIKFLNTLIKSLF
jgi:hypothetical protein